MVGRCLLPRVTSQTRTWTGLGMLAWPSGPAAPVNGSRHPGCRRPVLPTGPRPHESALAQTRGPTRPTAKGTANGQYCVRASFCRQNRATLPSARQAASWAIVMLFPRLAPASHSHSPACEEPSFGGVCPCTKQLCLKPQQLESENFRKQAVMMVSQERLVADPVRRPGPGNASTPVSVLAGPTRRWRRLVCRLRIAVFISAIKTGRESKTL